MKNCDPKRNVELKVMAKPAKGTTTKASAMMKALEKKSGGKSANA